MSGNMGCTSLAGLEDLDFVPGSGNGGAGGQGGGSVNCDDACCAVQLAAGEAHACARMATGDVWCWGNNGSGAVGKPMGNAEPTLFCTPHHRLRPDE